MAFTLDISVGLGRSKAGLTLGARLVDSDGANVTPVLTSGFSEIGGGWYLWHYEDYPDNFRGGVKFFEVAVPGATLTFVTLNPEEIMRCGSTGSLIIDNGNGTGTITVTSIARHVGDYTQGETVSLFLKTTAFDGTPVAADSVSVIVVEHATGLSTSSGVGKIMKDGYYAYAWNLEEDQTTGQYDIIWTFAIQGVSAVENQVAYVFEESVSMRILGGVTPELLLTFETYIDCAMNIPVYNEQARPSSGGRLFRFSFTDWNQTPGTRVWLNNQPVVDGITIDYFRGTVTFAEALTDYDVVEATYNFSWYKPEDLARFLINAVNVVNSFPPHSAYSVLNIPDRFVPAMLYKAAADAIRKLMLCLQFQQPQQVFGGPDKAQQAFSNFDSLKKNYEADWKVMAENKKYGPYIGLTRAVVVPEYTLPGGRSRWFRYLFSSGV